MQLARGATSRSALGAGVLGAAAPLSSCRHVDGAPSEVAAHVAAARAALAGLGRGRCLAQTLPEPLLPHRPAPLADARVALAELSRLQAEGEAALRVAAAPPLRLLPAAAPPPRNENTSNPPPPSVDDMMRLQAEAAALLAQMAVV